MAEKIIEKEICRNCGVDVRPNTLFCYNCGSSVASASNSIKTGYPTVKDKLLEENSRTSRVNGDADRKSAMKSAASLRQKNKPVQKKTVEVVWEEPESAPNLWFLVVAFLLTIFALGIFIAMRYVQ